VYFVGRSQEAGDRIAAECRELNSEGEFIFVKADVSLLKNVDDVCRKIASKEKCINLLFLTCGSALAHIGSYIVPQHGCRQATILTVACSLYRHQ
jgi:hypothetical protein